MKALVTVACGFWICALAACSRGADFERMRQQARVDPYSTSTIYSDGLPMRVPPAGTVALEEHGTDTTATGQHDYETYCSVCHGGDGSGHAVMATNIPGNPPLSLVAGDVVARTDMELLEVVDKGKNRMPRFDWALPEKARVAVVAYVRELQGAASAADGVSPQ